jgi:hypothetical protein
LLVVLTRIDPCDGTAGLVPVVPDGTVNSVALPRLIPTPGANCIFPDPEVVEIVFTFIVLIILCGKKLYDYVYLLE